MLNRSSWSAPHMRRRLARLKDDTGSSLVSALATVLAVGIIGTSGMIAVSNVTANSGTSMIMAQRDSYATTYLAQAVSGNTPLPAAGVTTTNVQIGPSSVPVSTLTRVVTTVTGTSTTVFVSLPRYQGVAAGLCTLSATGTAPAAKCIVRQALDRPDVATVNPLRSVGNYSAGANSLVPSTVPDGTTFMRQVSALAGAYRYSFHIQNVTAPAYVIVNLQRSKLVNGLPKYTYSEINRIRIGPSSNTDFYGDLEGAGVSLPAGQTYGITFALSGAAADISGAIIYEVH